MNPVHYWPNVGQTFHTRFGHADTAEPRDVTCEPCLAAIRNADEPLAWEFHRKVLLAEFRGKVLLADELASRDERYVRRMTAHLLRYGGTSLAAKNAVIAEDWEAARAEDRLRRNLDQASEVERQAAAEVGEWSALLADATAMRRRLSAQLRLVQGVRGTPTPTAPVNAVQDTSGGPYGVADWRAPLTDFERRAGVVPPVEANPYARHDMAWPGSGSGLCVRFVVRPNGTIQLCREPAYSPVHG